MFDWDPLISSVSELVEAPGGVEASGSGSGRRTNEERRQQYYEMMDQRAKGREERQAVREASVFAEDVE